MRFKLWWLNHSYEWKFSWLTAHNIKEAKERATYLYGTEGKYWWVNPFGLVD